LHHLRNEIARHRTVPSGFLHAFHACLEIRARRRDLSDVDAAQSLHDDLRGAAAHVHVAEDAARHGYVADVLSDVRALWINKRPRADDVIAFVFLEQLEVGLRCDLEREHLQWEQHGALEHQNGQVGRNVAVNVAGGLSHVSFASVVRCVRQGPF
jgi:hypothetical protein